MLLFRTCWGNSWAGTSVPPLPPPLSLAIKQSRSDTDICNSIKKAHYVQPCKPVSLNSLIQTRPKPPYRQGLAGSWGKDTIRQVHSGCSQRLTLRLRRSAPVGCCCLNMVTIWRVHLTLGIARSLAPYTHMNNHIQKSLFWLMNKRYEQ